MRVTLKVPRIFFRQNELIFYKKKVRGWENIKNVKSILIKTADSSSLTILRIKGNIPLLDREAPVVRLGSQFSYIYEKIMIY